jgi:hypothetical protein
MQLTYYVEQIQKLNEKKSKKNRLPRSPEYGSPSNPRRKESIKHTQYDIEYSLLPQKQQRYSILKRLLVLFFTLGAILS